MINPVGFQAVRDLSEAEIETCLESGAIAQALID
jgi:hypothetical protein